MLSRGRSDTADILLTDGWLRSTYAALRNLSFHGLRVAVADDGPVGMCQNSRYAASVHRYPYPAMDAQEAWVDHIAELCCRTGVRVLMPSHDETVIFARHKHRLPRSVCLPVASLAQLDRANDKDLSSAAALAAGVAIPRMVHYRNPAELSLLCAPDGRYVIRLLRSNSSKGVFHADGSGVAQIVASNISSFGLSPERFPLVQEHVAGEGWGVSCLYWEGKRIAHFTHRRLREKLHSGGTSTLRCQADNPVIEEMAFALLDSLGWHGLAMVEFKYDPLTNAAWFIEINPRLWGSIGLAVAAGVEFPWLLYLCATEGPESAIRAGGQMTLRKGLVARWLLGEGIAAVSSLVQGHPRRALSHVFAGHVDCTDDFFLDDPGAFAGELLAYGSRLIRFRSLNPAQEGMIG